MKSDSPCPTYSIVVHPCLGCHQPIYQSLSNRSRRSLGSLVAVSIGCGARFSSWSVISKTPMLCLSTRSVNTPDSTRARSWSDATVPNGVRAREGKSGIAWACLFGRLCLHNPRRLAYQAFLRRVAPTPPGVGWLAAFTEISDHNGDLLRRHLAQTRRGH